MIYRPLAGEQVSQLGFGAMRLPQHNGTVNEAEAIRMIRHAIDNGINYVDTAWVYHDGISEIVVGKALQDGYRQKTFVATKSPIWLIQKPEDFDDFLDKQLAKLQTDHIDYYLLHALNAGTWDICKKFDAIGFCERAKQSGKIRHFGFSFHDDSAVFTPIINHYPWEFCQIQYNFLDRGYQAGQAGLERARAQGTDIVVMEPLRGGNLAGPIPTGVQKLYDSQSVKRSAVDWALRWIWNQPTIGTVLSGMSTMEQLVENLQLADQIQAGKMTTTELQMMDQAELEYRRLIKVNCTACKYCLPCPAGVDIPRNFSVYNNFFMFEQSAAAKAGYTWVPAAERADQCVDCGQCEELCPQHIAIRQELKQVTAALT